MATYLPLIDPPVGTVNNTYRSPREALQHARDEAKFSYKNENFLAVNALRQFLNTDAPLEDVRLFDWICALDYVRMRFWRSAEASQAHMYAEKALHNYDQDTQTTAGAEPWVVYRR